jgi:hypothetical protein
MTNKAQWTQRKNGNVDYVFCLWLEKVVQELLYILVGYFLNSSCLLFLSSFVYGFKVLVVKFTYSSLVVVGLLTDVDIVNYNNV